MDKWRILVPRSVRKQLLALDPAVQRRVRDTIDRLPDGDIKRLRGPEDLYRARAGDWRVILRLNSIGIVGVFRRDKAYR